MTKFPFDLVTIDIDGTLTIESGWRYFARRLGREAQYGATEAPYRAGQESEDRHLRDLLELVDGVSLGRVETLMEETPKLSGISEAVQELKSLGATVALLSHNPGYVSEWYVRRFGFEDWDGTKDRPVPEVAHGIIGSPGSISADKPGGLTRLLRRHPAPRSRVAHVGDSTADAAVFPLIGYGIALNALLPGVDRAADAALHVTDLRAVVPVLAAAHPRSVPNA